MASTVEQLEGNHVKLSVTVPAAEVDKAMEKFGVTADSLDAEISSQLTPANLEAGRDWYKDAQAFNMSLADTHGLSLEQATAITSAVSPRCPWPRNKQIAESVAAKHRDYLDDRRFPPACRRRSAPSISPTPEPAESPKEIAGCTPAVAYSAR